MEPVKIGVLTKLLEPDQRLNATFQLCPGGLPLARDFLARVFVTVELLGVASNPVPALNFLHEACQAAQRLRHGNKARRLRVKLSPLDVREGGLAFSLCFAQRDKNQAVGNGRVMFQAGRQIGDRAVPYLEVTQVARFDVVPPGNNWARSKRLPAGP